MLKTAHVFDFPLTVGDRGEVLGAVEGRIRKSRSGGVVSITNTESLYHARRIKAHGNFIRKADLSLCDGVGVVIGGWFWGERINRFHGPDFMLECCRYGESRGWRHFFYGGKEGVADTLVEKLKEKFPGLISAGTCCPPFRDLSEEEEKEIEGRINATNPDIVWVGLGLLKQEKWIARNRGRLDASWFCGVGAAFDFHSGAIERAPVWAQKIGLESVVRLAQQPRIRGPRYWWSVVFLMESVFGGMAHWAKDIGKGR